MDFDALVQAWRRRGEHERARRQERAGRARVDARRAAAVLKSEFGVAEVWLFGSVATEPRHDAFDIDLAVRGLPAARYFAALARVHDIAREPIELIPLETCTESVRRAVALTGQRIDGG